MEPWQNLFLVLASTAGGNLIVFTNAAIVDMLAAVLPLLDMDANAAVKAQIRAIIGLFTNERGRRGYQTLNWPIYWSTGQSYVYFAN